MQHWGADAIQWRALFAQPAGQFAFVAFFEEALQFAQRVDLAGGIGSGGRVRTGQSGSDIVQALLQIPVGVEKVVVGHDQ